MRVQPALGVLVTAAAALAEGRDPRPAATPPPAEATLPTGLTDVAASSGIRFVHFIGASGEFYFPEIMGSGGALLDYDNDGDLDVYLLQDTMLGAGRAYKDSSFPPQGPVPPCSRLYRNELISSGKNTGELRFTDVTEASGAGLAGYAMGAATGDYDNDGDLDILVTAFGPEALLRNNGDGTFTDVTAAAGLTDARWTSSATFFDYDNDGWLDLFVAAYADFTVATHKRCFTPAGARDYCNPRVYQPLPSRLYHNRGDGTFQNVTAEMGLDTLYGHALGVVAADFDGNGWDDLFVANDGDANQLWMNQKGRFVESALMSGAALNMRGKPEAGMGIAAGDFDDDGDVDLFLTHLNGETNTLFQNMGGGQFDDATMRLGLGLPSLPFTSFGTGWIDLDHDGDQDLFIASGDVTMVETLAGDPYPYHQKNQIMINTGGKFEDRSELGGPVMALSEVSRGAAFGDVDNDGDLDILLTNNNGPARLLRNDMARPSQWIILKVVDKARRRDAIGAAVKLTLSDGRVMTRWVRTDGSYMSASDPRVQFAWPSSLQMKSLQVVMPGGRTLALTGVSPGRISTVTP